MYGLNYYKNYLGFISLILIISETFTQNTIDAWNDKSFIVNWNVNTSVGNISFELDVATTGWIAIGFSNDGYMANSDMIMGYIDQKGIPIVEDRWAVGRSLPELDTNLGGTNDLTNISGYLISGRTNIKFTRKLKTGDKYDYEIIQGKSYKILLAFRSIGNPSTENGAYNQHTKMISTSAILYPNSESTILPASLETYKTLNITLSNITIAKTQTSYMCQFFRVDQLLKSSNNLSTLPKYHAVKFEPIFNSKFVHHILFFGCARFPSNVAIGPFECQESMEQSCTNIIGLAGVGSSSLDLPPEAAFVWGSEETTLVYMQIHYDNSNLIEGVKDNSGFKIYYTEKLRPYNMGVSIHGYPIQKISLQGGQKSIVLSDQCNCNMDMDPKGINIVFAALHGHKLLKKIRTEITYPNGKTDSTTFRNDNYDFTMQYINLINPTINVKKGTSFKTICEYDTTGINTTTIGGESTSNEMCFSFIGYYPKEMNFAFCMENTCILNPLYRYTDASNSSVSLPTTSDIKLELGMRNLFLMITLIFFYLF